MWLLLSLAASWSAMPHWMIAQIAQTTLSSDARKWVNDLLGLWTGETGDMVTLAAWHDNIRTSMTAPWHFVDTPIVDPAYTGPTPPPVFNVSDLLLNQLGAIQCGVSDIWTHAFMIRAFVHLIGDIHCPVHVMEGYSAKFPDGDRGGNSITISIAYSGKSTNLHHYWDGGLDLYTNSTSKLDMDKFRAECDEIIQSHPSSTFSEELKERNPQQWADSVHPIAVDYVYGKLLQKEDKYSVDQAYADAGRPHVQRLIALAGYRLAQTLKDFHEKVTGDQDPVISDGSGTTAKRVIVVWGADASVGLLIAVYVAAILLKKNRKADEASSERMQVLLRGTL
jgi:hypothetical protein